MSKSQVAIALFAIFFFMPYSVAFSQDLFSASSEGKLAIVEDLIAKGSDVNAKDDYDRTALMFAAAYDHMSIIKVLLSKRAKINEQDKDGMTALLFAVNLGHLPIVEELLANGANIGIKGDNGLQLLLAAAIGRPVSTGGQLKIIQLIISKGSLDSIDYKMAYYLSDLRCHNEVKNFFKAKGVTLDQQVYRAALMSGVSGLARGMDDSVYKIGIKDIWMLVEKDNITEIETFLATRNNVNMQNSCGRTALMNITRMHNTDIATVLLNKGADVNIKDANGQTALIKATIYGSIPMIKLLLNKGADVAVKTLSGKTALKYAKEDNSKSRNEIINILKAAGAKSGQTHYKR